jgi:hypothetical protein
MARATTVSVGAAWTGDEVGGVPATLFVHRQTDFDRFVLTARWLRQYSEGSLTATPKIASLLDKAADSATQTRRVDQMLWLANAYDTEFADLPGAMFKAQDLRAKADRLVRSGDFQLSPFRYPGLDYGLWPGGFSQLPTWPDPYAIPPKPPVPGPDREQQTRDTQTYLNMLRRDKPRFQFAPPSLGQVDAAK